jgi:hypothetical protein
VIVNTGTVLGVAVAENPGTGLYEARFGYARTEFAYVPSNRARNTNEVSTGNGAKDVADVLLELRMENIFKGGLVYQRMAVGTTAVSQQGAALLFSKNADGTLDPAVASSVRTVPTVNSAVVSAQLPLAQAYSASTQKEAFDAVARKSGYTDFAAFLTDPKVSLDTVKTVTQDLRNLSLIPQ